ncbi:MAG: aspartate/glutamate racemase family protein [Deltaproteobacteria bacterium]|nr:aspartate/glutamate racemase family protein [Candidatus Zymogenaceae bacterium]
MHKTIGILGGLSPESTVVYYETIVTEYRDRFGDQHYPEIIMYSVDFDEYTEWFVAGKWEDAGRNMAEKFEHMRAAGADFGLIASNTPHRALDTITANTTLPILSIVAVTADAVKKAKVKTVGLLGTRFTMQEEFYRRGLEDAGIAALIPEGEDLDRVHEIIYTELVRHIITDESRTEYLHIIDRLIERGAGGIILGCTEIPLLIKPGDLSVPVFDTTAIHAEAALERAVKK